MSVAALGGSFNLPANQAYVSSVPVAVNGMGSGVTISQASSIPLPYPSLGPQMRPLLCGPDSDSAHASSKKWVILALCGLVTLTLAAVLWCFAFKKDGSRRTAASAPRSDDPAPTRPVSQVGTKRPLDTTAEILPPPVQSGTPVSRPGPQPSPSSACRLPQQVQDRDALCAMDRARLLDLAHDERTDPRDIDLIFDHAWAGSTQVLDHEALLTLLKRRELNRNILSALILNIESILMENRLPLGEGKGREIAQAVCRHPWLGSEGFESWHDELEKSLKKHGTSIELLRG